MKELIKLVEIIIQFIEPLVKSINNREEASILFNELGYSMPSDAILLESMKPVFDTFLKNIHVMVELIEEEENDKCLMYLPSFINCFKDVIDAIYHIDFDTDCYDSDFVNVIKLDSSFAIGLFDYLLVKLLQDTCCSLYPILMLLGVIEEKKIFETPTTYHIPYIKRIVHWNLIPDRIINPIDAIKKSYFSEEELKFDKLIGHLFNLANYFLLFPDIRNPEPILLKNLNKDGNLIELNRLNQLKVLDFPFINSLNQELGCKLYPIINLEKIIDGIGIGLYFSLDQELLISENFRIKIKSSSNLSNGLGLKIKKDGKLEFLNNIFTADASTIAENCPASFKISFISEAGEGSAISIGNPQGSRFEIGKCVLHLGLEKEKDYNLYLETDFQDCLFSLGLQEADGFIKKTCRENGVSSSFDFSVGWSSKDGLHFSGSAALDTTIQIHKSIGPICIDSVYLSMTPTKSGNIPIHVATTLKTLLGPVQAKIENIGLTTRITFPEKGGNFGPADISIAFKSPDGIAILVNAPNTIGGGRLFFDSLNNHYTGILQLEINKKIALTAIGIITTRLPDGSDGFSMLFSMFAEFNPGIQLGFGFTLNGIGGLIGINRAMAIKALQKGVRSGATDTVMFPDDPLKNPQKLFTSLESFFPATEDRFVIGPMGLLAWGTPPIIQAEIGLLIELPDPVRIALLGQLRMVLPSKEKDLIKIKLDVFGYIDFNKKELGIDATIYDSYLLKFPLSGDMAFRLNWGDQPMFILSVGGFHPSFTPPSGFPKLRRLTVSIGKGDNPRLTLDHYIAVTSNTVQFGSNLDLHGKACGFIITGHLGFDALFIFSPFSFIVDIRASVRLRGRVSVSVGLAARLSGPTPWNVRGKASFKVCRIRFRVPFNFTIGKKDEELLASKDISSILLGALRESANWAGALPPYMQMVTSLRSNTHAQEQKVSQDEAENKEPNPVSVVVMPMCPLEIRQTVLPLKQELSQFGHHKPKNYNYFEITSISLADIDEALTAHDIQDYFAPAQFLEMEDEEKLAAPSFEKQPAGISICNLDPDTSEGFDFGEFCARKSIRYESVIIDDLETGEHLDSSEWLDESENDPVIQSDTRDFLTNNTAAKRAPYHKSGAKRYNSKDVKPKIEWRDPQYKVQTESETEITKKGRVESGMTFFDAYRLRKEKSKNQTDRTKWFIDAYQEAA
ncbi:hypothetical protein EH223_18920 [candidate division KSB1 bacterium]|nr:hypothetical protein [candidate division KSB1 bacterium]RQW00376.1 MAG: hypothetical protein EH223_18920 [candidate division KSB1 bacterium]